MRRHLLDISPRGFLFSLCAVGISLIHFSWRDWRRKTSRFSIMPNHPDQMGWILKPWLNGTQVHASSRSVAGWVPCSPAFLITWFACSQCNELFTWLALCVLSVPRSNDYFTITVITLDTFWGHGKLCYVFSDASRIKVSGLQWIACEVCSNWHGEIGPYTKVEHASRRELAGQTDSQVHLQVHQSCPGKRFFLISSIPRSAIQYLK